MTLGRLFRTATFRLTSLYVLVFVSSAAAIAGLTYLTLKDALERKVESDIRFETDALVAAYRAGGLDQLKLVLDPKNRGKSWRFQYHVVSSDGTSVLSFSNVAEPHAGSPPTPDNLQYDLAPQAGIKALTVALDDRYRLSVASNRVVLREVERVLVEIVGSTILATILLGVCGGIFVSLRFLNRVDTITSTALSISNGDLKKRIPTRGSNDELDRLSNVLNDMLNRMLKLMESLQQVSNDIAHDLRTPISRLRHRLDGALASEMSPIALRNTLEAAVADTDVILETFGALLRIAQIESGSRKSAFRSLSLDEVVEAVTEAYLPSIQDDKKHLETNLAPNASLVGDQELLTQLISNLIENAIRYTSEGCVIRVNVTHQSEHVILEVCDNGPGVSASIRDKLFDRFYRGDQSRRSPGSGLGLSIVKAVADLHSATISLRENNPGLIVEVRFPSSHG